MQWDRGSTFLWAFAGGVVSAALAATICVGTSASAQDADDPIVHRLLTDVQVDPELVRDVPKTSLARAYIPATIDLEIAATMLMALVDGLYWRRAVDPEFDAETVLPTLLSVTHFLLTDPNNSNAKNEMAGRTAAKE